MDMDCSDEGLNRMLEREEGLEKSSESESDCTRYSESDADEELLRLDELNREMEEAAKKEAAEEEKEDLSALSRLLASFYREGPAGSVSVARHAFLSVFEGGVESAWLSLQEQGCALLREADEEMKGSKWKKLSKQKPLKHRIKQTMAEKAKKMQQYEDLPFAIATTRDFCYKTGLRILVRKNHEHPQEKLRVCTKVHEKMEGFFAPSTGYAWDEEKISQFLPYVFAG
ncbi:hypothetical protein NEDG_00583 [Nematocida displodere]|uniref:Uncharacterized protein n=1 Tax=Nematocida displodere TaxID=1805483 RepID=A0A177EDI1_9MICR|nr:hypothetical protein NEDG_00583 [Nematocida displodere]